MSAKQQSRWKIIILVSLSCNCSSSSNCILWQDTHTIRPWLTDGKITLWESLTCESIPGEENWYDKWEITICFPLILHILLSSAAVVSQSKSTELCSTAAVVPQSKSSEMWISAAPFDHDSWYFRLRTNELYLYVIYSGTPLMRPPLDHKILVVITRWSH